MKIRVLKFDESSFVNPTQYHRVAAHLLDRLSKDADKIVVVVSAMLGVTDHLKSIALEINDKCPAPIMDSALVTGEMLSVAFLEAAISRLHVSVNSATGHALGIRTDSVFGRASIKSVDKAALTKMLLTQDIVIAGGARALDDAGRLTTLDRDSSDLSAVAIAAALGCENCEIYSGPCGVYTADPYLINGARLIRTIPHAVLGQMSRHGATVLHYRGVDYASKHGVDIICKTLTDGGGFSGTHVTQGQAPFAVVVNPTATVLRYPDPSTRSHAREILKSVDITSAEVAFAGGHALCISNDAEFAIQHLNSTGCRPHSVALQAIVTEFTPSSQRVHLTPDLRCAITLAQIIHDRFYRSDAAALLKWTRRPSSYSSLLTASVEDSEGAKRSLA